FIHNIWTRRAVAGAAACRWTVRAARPISSKPQRAGASSSDVLKAIFTWWNGATIGARFQITRRGVLVGEDDYGARYYEAKDTSDSYDGRKRRWVIYDGYADASKVPPDWHGWLHYTFAEPPTVAPFRLKPWEK